MKREAGNRTVLPAKLGMPAVPVPTSWLQCAVWGADAKTRARGGTWKELQSPKVRRHGKGNKKTNWCWGQVNKKAPSICIAECYAQVLLQSILCVAALHTAGHLQYFQGHWTRQDALGHPGPFPAIVGMLSFSPIVN